MMLFCYYDKGCPYNKFNRCERGVVVINKQGVCQALTNRFLEEEAKDMPREKIVRVEVELNQK